MKIDRDGTPFIAVSALPAVAAAVTGHRRAALALLAAFAVSAVVFVIVSLATAGRRDPVSA